MYVCMGPNIDILPIPESPFSCESLQGSDITLKGMWSARAYFYTEGSQSGYCFQLTPSILS